MAAIRDTSYGNPSPLEYLGIAGSVFLHLPLVLGWGLLTSPFHHNYRHKSWKRVLSDKLFSHLTERLSVKQLQWVLGNTRDIYTAWAKSNGLPLVVDELGENARLLWFGERRTDRVILYFHGGAYLLPIQSSAAPFWRYVQTELKGKGKDVGFAMLNYSLIPTVTFPTQLKQAVLALQHILAMGVDPQNIQITGDSAGAGLTMQLISHILHPVPDVPRVVLSSPIRQIYLMSPWISLRSKTGSMLTNDDSDILGIACLTYWGREVLYGLPESQRAYLEPVFAPDAWFEKIRTVVDRVLITAGDAECLRDEITLFAKQISKHHDSTQFVIQKYGVHNDPFLDFLTMESKLGELTPLIVEWFAAGFA